MGQELFYVANVKVLVKVVRLTLLLMSKNKRMFYLDPKVLSAVEKGALEIKIFGSKNDLNINPKVTHKGDTNKKTIYELT
jgi:hypothetical protein